PPQWYSDQAPGSFGSREFLDAIAYRRISAGVSEARWSEGRNMIVESRFGGSDAGRAPTAVRWPRHHKLAEEAPKRDYNPPDPCGQAKEQQKVAHEERHTRASPFSSPAQGHLDTPSIAPRPIPDTGTITKYFALALDLAASPEPRVTCAFMERNEKRWLPNMFAV